MISIKRGDTFAFMANITNEEGNPLIKDAVNLKSQIRDKHDNLISELTITATETPGQYLFVSPSTEDWPAFAWGENMLQMDIEINVEGQIASSDTIDIEVIKDVTRNE